MIFGGLAGIRRVSGQSGLMDWMFRNTLKQPPVAVRNEYEWLFTPPMALPSPISIGQAVMPAGTGAEDFVKLSTSRRLCGHGKTSCLAIHHFSMEDTSRVIEAGQS